VLAGGVRITLTRAWKHARIVKDTCMIFELSAAGQAVINRVEAFFSGEILPRHREWVQAVKVDGVHPPFIRELQEKARSQGLWNLALPGLTAGEPGTRLSNFEYAHAAEILGRLPWASLVMNCQAPDVPNMVMMQELVTPQQRERWLMPLLRGEIQSAFGMTEPATASSDATNIATSIERDGDQWVINGHKWYINGAASPYCAFIIVVGVTEPGSARTGRHSMVLVPMDAPGVRVVRDLTYMGHYDHVAPFGEVILDDVRVPIENLLGERGNGFKGAQIRLGIARVHHCMRLIGLADVLVSLMMARAGERHTFGKTLIEYDTVQRWIAEARIDIDMNRLFVQRAAWLLDHGGPNDIRKVVSQIKVATPRMMQTISDRAAQVFGAMGGCEDTLIPYAWAYSRLLRIGDGPDEVHLRQVFRNETMPPWSIADCPYISTPRFG
jgi:acyl-CoA dehydrogenase